MNKMMEKNFQSMIGKTIKSFKEEEEGVSLHFEDGTSCLLFQIRPGENNLGCLWAITTKDK